MECGTREELTCGKQVYSQSEYEPNAHYPSSTENEWKTRYTGGGFYGLSHAIAA